MKHRATIILVALGLLLMSGGLLLVAYSDEESQSGDGESHSEGAPQNRDARPGSPSAAGPSGPTASDSEASQVEPFTNSAEQSVAASATRSSITPSPSSSGSTADVLLAQQIVAVGHGGGHDGRCSISGTPASPAAYLSNFLGQEGLEVELVNWVGVCLRGFDPAAPVGLTVDVGDRSYQTEIRLTDDEVEGEYGIVDYPDRPETLFDGMPLTAFRVSGENAYRTTVWEFVPPSAVRDTIVSVILTARQGELSSQIVQLVNIPEGPGEGEEMLSNGRELAVWGFPAGRRVEIGLYRRDGNSDVFSLMRRVGVVTMPASSLAIFTAPEDVIREAGDNPDYCLSAPVEAVHPCKPYS